VGFEAALLSYFVAANVPFRTVESPEFHNLLALCRPSLQLPSRYKLQTFLQARAVSVKSTIRELLATAHGISLAIDIWTSPNKLGFLAINAYHISRDMQYHETLLRFIVLHGSHNGESIAKHIMETLEQYNIRERLIAVTVDNAAPNMKFLRLLSDQLLEKGVQWDYQLGGMPCLAHVIQLSARDFLNVLKAAPDNEQVDRQLNDSRIDSISSELSFGNALQKVPGAVFCVNSNTND
jgi:hypothetical protein